MKKNRLFQEYKDIIDNPIVDIKVQQSQMNAFKWFIDVEGPKGSHYYGGKFKFELNFPSDYPFRPPNIQLKTIILHINSGQNWSPSVKMRGYLQELKSIFFYEKYIHLEKKNIELYNLLITDEQLYQQKVNEVMAEAYFDDYILLPFIAFRKEYFKLFDTNPDQIFIDLFF